LGIDATPKAQEMNAVVCDASLLFKLVVSEADTDRAQALVGSVRVIVPEFAFLEIGNALWSRVRRGELDIAQAKRLVYALLNLRFETLHIEPFLDRALEIASAIDHPIYDCLYIAMAEHLAVPLVTADKRLASAIRRAGLQTAQILMLNDYAQSK
jgi:predicted nucleic acid-binding protein